MKLVVKILFLFLLLSVSLLAQKYQEVTDPALLNSISGMTYYETAYKAIMNNSVHSTTPGYKAGGVASRIKGNNRESVFFYRFVQGPPVKSGGSLDFFIEGRGFFVISCPWGTSYTRDGRFTLDEYGKLVTLVGKFPVLGESGDIILNNSATTITESGAFVLDNTVIAILKIDDFKDTKKLKSINGSIFYPENEYTTPMAPKNGYIIKQGYYEGSNVNLVGQLSKFPEVKNIYDANTKAAKIVIKSLSAGIQMGAAE
jgi:flagellar basal-body rod protein FlgF